jgi:predicted alpha/beta hydrolase family esterase
MPSIDFSQLREEVLQHWENTGVPAFDTENVGFTAPDPEKWITTVKEEFQFILDNVYLCIAELGFTSISAYLASKQE